MSVYNINTISFLIASFNDVINNFGKNNKSVDFYKLQVSKLIAIGQINTQDASIVEEIIGMQNTSAVKWDIAEHKLNSFIGAMNEVIGYDSQEAIMFVVEGLVAQKIITEQIASIIYKLYDIDIELKSKLYKKKDTTAKFGVIDTSKPVKIEQTIKKNNQNREKINKNSDYNDFESVIKVLKELIKINTPNVLYITVKNLKAVCSGDPSTINQELNSFIKDLTISQRSRSLTEILEFLKNGARWSIGPKIETGDSCHPRTVIENKYKRENLNIDWERVMIINEKTSTTTYNSCSTGIHKSC